MSEGTTPDPAEVSTLKRQTQQLFREIYWNNFQAEAAGFFVPLQFLAVVWGVENCEGEELLGHVADGEHLRFVRRSHDFIRRLLNDGPDGIPGPRRRDVATDDTLRVMGKVFEALTVPRKFSRKPRVLWNARHLQPYLGELVHHDGVNIRSYERNERTEVADNLGFERVYYRGGGTLAYQIFSADEDLARRDRIKVGLQELVADSDDDAVGRLAKTLHAADALKVEPWEDRELVPYEESGETNWTKNLRDGTDRILTSATTDPKKIDYLMHWIPYCLARHMVERAFAVLEMTEEPSTPVDVGAEGTLRRISQVRFDEHGRVLREAVIHRLDGFDDGHRASMENLFFRPIKFYRATMAHVGAVNHNAGIRHYTLKLPILETIVHAMVDKGEPKKFDTFCTEILCGKLRLVVDDKSGQNERLTQSINHTDLKRNASALKARLAALGLITDYSDDHKMVGPRQ